MIRWIPGKGIVREENPIQATATVKKPPITLQIRPNKSGSDVVCSIIRGSVRQDIGVCHLNMRTNAKGKATKSVKLHGYMRHAIAQGCRDLEVLVLNSVQANYLREKFAAMIPG